MVACGVVCVCACIVCVCGGVKSDVEVAVQLAMLTRATSNGSLLVYNGPAVIAGQVKHKNNLARKSQ